MVSLLALKYLLLVSFTFLFFRSSADCFYNSAALNGDGKTLSFSYRVHHLFHGGQAHLCTMLIRCAPFCFKYIISFFFFFIKRSGLSSILYSFFFFQKQQTWRKINMNPSLHLASGIFNGKYSIKKIVCLKVQCSTL